MQWGALHTHPELLGRKVEGIAAPPPFSSPCVPHLVDRKEGRAKRWVEPHPVLFPCSVCNRPASGGMRTWRCERNGGT